MPAPSNRNPNPATDARPGSGNVQRTLGGMYRDPENRLFRRVRVNLRTNYKIRIQRINFFYLIYIHGEIRNNFM